MSSANSIPYLEVPILTSLPVETRLAAALSFTLDHFSATLDHTERLAVLEFLARLEHRRAKARGEDMG